MGNAKTVLIMSDPSAVPRPAITKVLDAEMAEEGSPDEPLPEPTQGTVVEEEDLEGFRIE